MVEVVLASSDPTLTSQSMQVLQRLGFAELATMTPARALARGSSRGVAVVRQVSSDQDLVVCPGLPTWICDLRVRRSPVDSLDEFLAGSIEDPKPAGSGLIVGVRPDGEVEFYRR